VTKFAAIVSAPFCQRTIKLKSSIRLFTDETTAPVLDPRRGRTKTGSLSAYARDDRP
jgi:transposase